MATGAEASRSRSAAPQRGTRGAGRRRRPSGEPPPLPRRLGVSGRVWIALAVSLLAVVGLILAYRVLGAGFDRWDSVVLRGIVPVRTGWLVAVAAGGRPGQHDAGAGGPHQRRACLPARLAAFHPRRGCRGVRRDPRGGEPLPAPIGPEAGRPGPDG